MAESDQNLIHTHISAKHRLMDLRLSELKDYRDLILLYTKRSLVVNYKQTILGPLWMVIAPLVTSIMHMVVFGMIAGLSTDHVPQIIFYLFGNASWAFFSSILLQCSDTFLANSYLFGKVYFPRLAIPISNACVSLVQFAIQFVLGCCFMIYYHVTEGFDCLSVRWVLIPVVMVWLALAGYGFGILASSMTTRYRDLRILVNFGVRLWMYISPVVYPLSQLDGNTLLRKLMLINPLTAPMECMRWCLWGRTEVPAGNILWSLIITAAVALAGTVAFTKVERTFMDTV